ncbi:PREDICTED: uncharacterized protein LOC104824829 [Tarenaya hassleriana]|uniref:uncharacterized protein LOC104824829 n=1 Tax=Tarenaya hassleriana TaxID=28532 RepID=UPI00053C8652|nr:PREDICTED: uncharacterized protein LOC104824829 [Tarenaya hassleriana]
MGNCGLKPKVLTDAGAPAPEQPKEPLLEDHKAGADKSLSNLFLEDEASKKLVGEEKPMSEAEKEKTAPETGEEKTTSTGKTSTAETRPATDCDDSPAKEDNKVVYVIKTEDEKDTEKDEMAA